MIATNGDTSRVEKFNQLVRGGCVLMLLGGLVFVFIWGAFDQHKVVVSSDAYISVLSGALIWWFKSRDEEKRRSDLAPTPGTVTTTTTGPVKGDE